MTVARHYVMIAAEGQHAALESALRGLADALKSVPGSEGADLLRDLANDRRFVFIEKWASVDAHKAAGQHLPKEALAPVMAAIDGRPEGAYLDYLLTT